MSTAVRQLTIFGTSEPARDKTADRITPFGPGYPARPGSGPLGENCSSCAHLLRLKFKRGRVVFKCDRVAGVEVKNRHTDIRLSAPACMGWERAPDPAPEPVTATEPVLRDSEDLQAMRIQMPEVSHG